LEYGLYTHGKTIMSILLIMHDVCHSTV